ncbi:MAG: hypothetical protein ACR5LB_08740 [Wolbachia sp.]
MLKYNVLMIMERLDPSVGALGSHRLLRKLPANCNVRTVVRVTLESKVKKV